MQRNPYTPPSAIAPEVESSEKSENTRLRIPRGVYIALCLLGPIIPLAITFISFFPPAGPPPHEGLVTAIGLFYLSVLSYPLGAVGTVCYFGLVFSGIATPMEGLLVSTPVFVLFGYFQWFVWLPKAFGASRRAA